MHNPFSLSGKTILVVGASSGIGKSTAIECAKMGARIVIAARRKELLEQTMAQLEGGGHSYFVCDITKEEDSVQLVADIPPIDGLVLSVGTLLLMPLNFSKKSTFENIFQVNFFAQIELIRLFNKKKKLQQSGSIVLISSVGGTGVYNIGNSVYGTSKAALDAYCKYAAKEYAARKIRVNTVNPGMVHTDLIESESMTDEDFAADIAKYPLKRYGKPEEIAHACVYLLSDASSWITGHGLVIDGGISI